VDQWKLQPFPKVPSHNMAAAQLLPAVLLTNYYHL
jgi:hypothetical protein